MATLLINGKSRTVDADSDTPLLWVLREHLQLTGTKFGCGMAQCGACTVHIDGVPTRSCITAVSDAAGTEIVTIEGVSGKVATAVQTAWVKLDVPQCGYCQSGQMMAAASLLAKTAAPSDADIDEAMRVNICRCGTYPQIRRAIHRAAAIEGGRA